MEHEISSAGARTGSPRPQSGEPQARHPAYAIIRDHFLGKHLSAEKRLTFADDDAERGFDYVYELSTGRYLRCRKEGEVPKPGGSVADPWNEVPGFPDFILKHTYEIAEKIRASGSRTVTRKQLLDVSLEHMKGVKDDLCDRLPKCAHRMGLNVLTGPDGKMLNVCEQYLAAAEASVGDATAP